MPEIGGDRRFYERVLAIVGEKGIVVDAQQIDAMTTAWRDSYPSKAALVVQPANTEELRAVVRVCAAANVPIVAQGGNTGMTGAALPRAEGQDLLLSTRRLNKICEIDLDDDMMIVEAGCVLQDIRNAAAEIGRLFPLSLGAQGSCTIGGNIATNAGGINAVRYGQMRDLVSGLEVVLANGEVWNGLKRLRKDNSGYDLKHLFIGSEGTLGIVTAAVLKLSAMPARSATPPTRSPGCAVFDADLEVKYRLAS